MEVATLYRQQIDVQKKLYEQRLEDIVYALKCAAEDCNEADDLTQLEQIKKAIFCEREAAVSRMIDQITTLTSDMYKVKAENEELKKQLAEREQSHIRLKQIYQKDHNELKSIRLSQQTVNEPELRYRIQFLEQQLKQSEQKVEEMKSVKSISLHEHEIIVNRMSAQNQTLVNQQLQQMEQKHNQILQQQQFTAEKQIQKLKLGFDKRINQMNQQQAQLKLEQQAGIQTSQFTQEISAQFQEKLKEVDKIGQELLKEKQKSFEFQGKNKILQAKLETITKQTREILKELNGVKESLRKVQNQVSRKQEVIATDQIKRAVDMIKNKTVNQKMMKTLADCVYAYTQKKQEQMRMDVEEVMQEMI
ncbi:Conserved_hypothetical protein [Hexamita inflata]|uniref:Uncharacterized protein n=1 Tax=Hexamita inflata TaxID=28002 RepID=A0AA86RF70_9EUKA|nr:Conserved hypothetical protein [Hexamita inflata]